MSKFKFRGGALAALGLAILVSSPSLSLVGQPSSVLSSFRLTSLRGEVGFDPVSESVANVPSPAALSGGGGGGPSVQAGGACGTVQLEASYISPTATRWNVYIYSAGNITVAEDVHISYDVGNNTGSDYFDPRGTDYTATSQTISAYQSYGDVSASFSGWVYDNGIGWCYFNTPELYYQLN